MQFTANRNFYHTEHVRLGMAIRAKGIMDKEDLVVLPIEESTTTSSSVATISSPSNNTNKDKIIISTFTPIHTISVW